MTIPAFEVEGLSREQIALQERCAEFAAEVIAPRASAVDQAETEFARDVWDAASDAGLTSFWISEEFGGGGLSDCMSLVVAAAELCLPCIGLGQLVTINSAFTEVVLQLGDREQHARWLPMLSAQPAAVTALANTEREGGSDAAAIRTHAERVSGGYEVTGRKSWIGNAALADLTVLFATVAPGTGARGITTFVVERSDSGKSFSPIQLKLGQRAFQNVEIEFDRMFLPEDRRLGAEGAGFYGLMKAFDRGRVVISAAHTALAKAALDYAVDYAGQREAFGRPISDYQGVSFRLADVATKVRASWLLTIDAARRADAGLPFADQASMAKLFSAETAMLATWAAVQTLGAWGYGREHPVEKWFRDAKLTEIEEGTSEIQKLIISRALFRSRAYASST